MIRISTKGSSNADPFLVATAILEGGIIVTDEKSTGIPNVCNMEGIPYMNLNAFLNEILEWTRSMVVRVLGYSKSCIVVVEENQLEIAE